MSVSAGATASEPVSAAPLPSISKLDAVPEDRPSTPPPRQVPDKEPKTPIQSQPVDPPTTPGTRDYSSASAYLSSPIRSARSAQHHHIAPVGTMTPGRPSLKFNPSPSPFRKVLHHNQHLNNHLNHLNHPTGQLSLNSPVSVPPLPVQTFLMTPEQANDIDDLAAAKTALLQALEQSETYHRAAQQFRNLATQQIFQHKLLQVESDESERRFEVENSIQKREIEKLVVDIMGYDKTASTDQIRKRLRKTKQRVREMSEMLEVKDRQIADLQAQLSQHQHQHQHAAQVQQPQQLPYVLPPGSVPIVYGPYPSGYEESRAQQNGATPHLAPIDTRSATAQSTAPGSQPPQSATDSTFSDLELLASQTLVNGFQQKPHSLSAPPSAFPFSSSPHSSPFYAPFSPFATAPIPQQTQTPHFGSPEKRRRPSSSSTISAGSEDDTLEDN